MSAVNLLITFAVAKIVGVVFSWIWVALSRDYTQALVYSSMVLSLLPGISIGIYMFIKGECALVILQPDCLTEGRLQETTSLAFCSLLLPW
jgi:hypothetical protein